MVTTSFFGIVGTTSNVRAATTLTACCSAQKNAHRSGSRGDRGKRRPYVWFSILAFFSSITFDQLLLGWLPSSMTELTANEARLNQESETQLQTTRKGSTTITEYFQATTFGMQDKDRIGLD
ncbi:hypothetical protein TorRG33x02_013700 [Trema orientale]|uniref:Uncharacterized protein n=1 Tax=Trema orientale TaxID=63057 RepID=A0A2P5FX59_TREOI|nr:hypothetical protein TorRG33x02_013700 [Trema orientale]